MASKFDEEKRVLINDLTEEKSAHLQTLDLLAEEKKKSAQVPKLEQELQSLRVNFEEVQKVLIQTQKKHVEERNKSVVANQQVEYMQQQLEQMQQANDMTQTLLEESLQEKEELKQLIESNPTLHELGELTAELAELREKVGKLERDLADTKAENIKLNTLMAAASEERDRAVEELKNSKSSTSTLQAQLDEALFNVEMSSETIKDLHSQLAACGVAVAESPVLSGSTSNLLEQENAKLLEEINSLKANLVATETRLTRTTKQLNAFRLSASHEAKRNQATISSLQLKVAQHPELTPPPSPTPPLVRDQPSPASDSLNGSMRLDGEDSEETRKLVDDLRAQLRTAQDELASMRPELEVLREQKDEFNALRVQLAGLRSHKDDKASALEAKQQELEGLRGDLEKITAELAQAKLHAQSQGSSQAELDSLREQLTQGQQDVEHAMRRCAVLLKEDATKQTTIEDLRTRLSDNEAHLETVRTQLEKAQKTLEKETNNNAEMAAELESEREKRREAELAKEAQHTPASNADVEQELHALRVKAREAESHVVQLRAQLRSALDDLESEKNATSELVKEMERERSKHNKEEIEALRAQVRDNEHELREHSHRAVHVQQQLSTTTAELESLRAQYLSSQEQLEKALIDNLELEKQVEDELGKQQEKLDEIETLRNQLYQVREEYEKATAANTELEAQVQQTIANLEELRVAGGEVGELRVKLQQAEDKLRAANNDLLKKMESDQARDLEKDGEMEDMLKDMNTLRSQWQQSRESADKLSSANLELEKAANMKQMELNTLRAQMLATEREMEVLRVQVLQGHDILEKEKHKNMDLEKLLEEEKLKKLWDGTNDPQDEVVTLREQLAQAQETLEHEMLVAADQRKAEQDKTKKALEELERKDKVISDLERQLALLRAGEGALRAQVQQQEGQMDNIRTELRASHGDTERYKQMVKDKLQDLEEDEQKRIHLENVIETLQKENEGLAEKLHRKSESKKPNGKSDSPGKNLSETSEEESEEIEDDEDDDDDEDTEKEELKKAVTEEQQRTSKLVQAIYALQIELQQEKAKRSEMDRALTDLQRGNTQLTQEVDDLRNAWDENKSASEESREEEKRKAEKSLNSNWIGLEHELQQATGVRAVALRTIMQDLESAKEKDEKLAVLRAKQFQLIDKLNDAEVQLTENRSVLESLHRENRMGLEDSKAARELGSKLVQLEQQNAVLTERLSRATESQEDVSALEFKLVQLERLNATLNERLQTFAEAENEHTRDARAMESKLVQLGNRNADLEDEKIDFQRELTKLRAKLSKAGEVDDIESSPKETVTTLKIQLAERTAELAQANAELRHANVALEEHAACGVSITELKHKVSALEKIADSAKELELRNKGLIKLIDALEAQLQDAARVQRENVVLLTSSDQLKQKLTEAERIENRTAALSSVTDELRHRITELESTPDQLESLTEEMSVLEEERDDLAELNAKLEEDVKALKAAVEEAVARNEELAARVDQLEERNEELKLRNEELEEREEDYVVHTNTIEKHNGDIAERSKDLVNRNNELLAQVESLRAKLDDAKVALEAAEEERALNHNNFLNLQTALNEEKETVQSLEDTISSFKRDKQSKHKKEESEDEEYSKDKQIELEMELCKSQLLVNELRKELALQGTRSREDNSDTRLREELDLAEEELLVKHEEVETLKKELSEERQKLKKLLKEKKEERTPEARKERKEEKADREDTPTKQHSVGEYEVLKEEWATLRGECKVLREDRDIWREECNKAKGELTKLRKHCSELEVDGRELRLVIASVRRENEMIRRDNILLWERLDSWEALSNGVGTSRAEEWGGGVNNLLNQKTVLNDSGKSKPKPKKTRKVKKDEEKEEGEITDELEEGEIIEDMDSEGEETDSSFNRSALDRRDANGMDEMNASNNSARRSLPPSTSPIPLHPSHQPHLHPQDEDVLVSTVDTDSVMLEAKARAHQKSSFLILNQLEKLGAQLQQLVQQARTTSDEQYRDHHSHITHLTEQLASERNSTLKLRDVYDQDSQRIQEASLDALRSHLHGIKSVYNALTY